MSSQRPQHAKDLHSRDLRLLEDRLDSSQRALAAQHGISHCNMNYCLDLFMEKSLNRLGNFNNSQHNFKYVYLLNSAPIDEKTALIVQFLQHQMAEYEGSKAEIVALQADLSLPKS